MNFVDVIERELDHLVEVATDRLGVGRWRFENGRAAVYARSDRTVVAIHHAAFTIVAEGPPGGALGLSYFAGREGCARLGLQALCGALREPSGGRPAAPSVVGLGRGEEKKGEEEAPAGGGQAPRRGRG